MKEWGRFQQEIANWHRAIIPPAENTPRLQFIRSMEEVDELDTAIKRDVRQEIGEEATDVIIRMMGIAAIVGVNVDQTLDQKIRQTTQEKYPASVVRAHMDLGDDWRQAMRRQKTVWQARKKLR